MKKICLIYLGFVALFLAYWLIYAVAPEFHVRYLQGEDRGVEWITFAGFAGASITAFCTLRFRRGMSRLALVYLFMTGLFFFVCAGEEISWGQRILGFETPEEVLAVNEQGEFNLHNLKFESLHPSDLVSWYMKFMGIVLPLVFLFKMREKEAPLRCFLFPPELIPCFFWPEIIHLIRHLTSRVASRLIRPEAAHVVDWQNEELLEMYWGLCVFLAMSFIYAAWKRRTKKAENPS